MPFRSALLTNQNCVLDAMFTNSKFDAHQRGESIAIKHNVFTEKNENGKRILKKIFYFATVPLYGKTKRPPSSDPVCVCTDYCQRQQSSFKVNFKKNRFHQPNPQDNLKKKWTRIHLRDQEIENPTPPELILSTPRASHVLPTRLDCTHLVGISCGDPFFLAESPQHNCKNISQGFALTFVTSPFAQGTFDGNLRWMRRHLAVVNDWRTWRKLHAECLSRKNQKGRVY